MKKMAKTLNNNAKDSFPDGRMHLIADLSFTLSDSRGF